MRDFGSVLMHFRANILQDLLKHVIRSNLKGSIPVLKSTSLFVMVDPLGCLAPDEIYVQVSQARALCVWASLMVAFSYQTEYTIRKREEGFELSPATFLLPARLVSYPQVCAGDNCSTA